jgi:hypothetical protein
VLRPVHGDTPQRRVEGPVSAIPFGGWAVTVRVFVVARTRAEAATWARRQDPPVEWTLVTSPRHLAGVAPPQRIHVCGWPSSRLFPAEDIRAAVQTLAAIGVRVGYDP